MLFFIFDTMSKLLIYILLLSTTILFGQNSQLADTFFSSGEYKKALLEYDKLLAKQPHRTDVFIKKIKCHQELEQYNIARNALEKKLSTKYRQPQLYVELGYNYTLQKDSVNARKTYDKALSVIDENPNYAHTIGQRFENYSLLNEAEATYNKAISLNKNANFDFQLANIYGQQNKIEKMFDSYLKLIKKSKTLTATVQNLIGKFLSDDPKSENNILLKRALLKNLQTTPDVFWNEQLSWLFVQQQEYNKAFTQEKAIFKREGKTLNRIFDLAIVTKEHGDLETAIRIFNFINEQPLEKQTRIKVLTYLLEIKEQNSTPSEYNTIIKEYTVVLDSFGINNRTLNVQLAYAHFLAFKKHDIITAIDFLKENKNQSLAKFDKARYQMKLADILVADGKFNQALINYSKIQRHLKNNVLSQEARFKVAKTSYFKGDFDWALQQLKVLKTSTSQLIANDALDLHLLINDHINEDSLHVALKKYAKADLLAFQNKKEESITILTDILNQHPVNKIVDDVLFLQGKLLEKQGNYKKATSNYDRIINTLKESIFIDDALFRLAFLHLNKFGEKEKAINYFEAILFNHADSIHFVEAQKMYRKLRGDSLDNS